MCERGTYRLRTGLLGARLERVRRLARDLRPISRRSAVSCPSASLCVAGDVAGNILSSTNPTGGPIAWSIAAVSSNQSVHGVSLPVDLAMRRGRGGVTCSPSTDPTGGASAWTKTTPAQGNYICTPSRARRSRCAWPAVAAPASMAGPRSSRRPIRPAAQARGPARRSPPATESSMRCRARRFRCAWPRPTPEMSSPRPTRPAARAHGQKTTIDPGAFLTAVSCPSVSLCVASDGTGDCGNGDILTTTNPTGGASAWTKATIDPGATYRPGRPRRPLVPVGVAVRSQRYRRQHPHLDRSDRRRERMDEGAISRVNLSRLVPVALAVRSRRRQRQHPHLNRSDRRRECLDERNGGHPRLRARVNPCVSEQLYARDDQGTRVLDTAPPGQGNSIGNVALRRLAHAQLDPRRRPATTAAALSLARRRRMTNDRAITNAGLEPVPLCASRIRPRAGAAPLSADCSLIVPVLRRSGASKERLQTALGTVRSSIPSETRATGIRESRSSAPR